MTVYINDNLMTDLPNSCVYMTYLEGRCSSITMVFDDSEGVITALELEKGDTVQALEGNIDTGEMYISGIDYNGSQAAIRALSLPLSAFKTKTQSWENVSMMALIDDALEDTELEIEYMDRPSFTYKEAAMIEEEPLKFLSGKLALEGFGIRIENGTAYIFDERKLEKGEYELQLTKEDFSEEPKYSTDDATLISEVQNTYTSSDGREIKTTEKSGLEGKILRLNMAVDSVGESIRFSKGTMRIANRNEYLAEGSMENLDHKVGEVLYLADAPKGHTGENLIYMIKNDLANNKQTLYMRRPIEGDY